MYLSLPEAETTGWRRGTLGIELARFTLVHVALVVHEHKRTWNDPVASTAGSASSSSGKYLSMMLNAFL